MIARVLIDNAEARPGEGESVESILAAVLANTSYVCVAQVGPPYKRLIAVNGKVVAR